MWRRCTGCICATIGGMIWVLLEAGIALGLAIFIVWWTMRGRNDDPDKR
jgi:hypothetical protein